MRRDQEGVAAAHGSRVGYGGRTEFAKICPSSVSRLQNSFPYKPLPTKAGDFAMGYLPDHGLPLVQLKEQRRDLVVALQNRNGPVERLGIDADRARLAGDPGIRGRHRRPRCRTGSGRLENAGCSSPRGASSALKITSGRGLVRSGGAEAERCRAGSFQDRHSRRRLLRMPRPEIRPAPWSRTCRTSSGRSLPAVGSRR